jgi:hypothetical protein
MKITVATGAVKSSATAAMIFVSKHGMSPFYLIPCTKNIFNRIFSTRTPFYPQWRASGAQAVINLRTHKHAML